MAKEPNKDIIEAIKQVKLAELKRAEWGAAAYEKLGDAAVSQLKKSIKGEDLSDDPRLLTAADMANIYYRRLGEYLGKSTIANFNAMNKRAIAFWHRVYLHCKSYDVDPEHFVYAQFLFFKRVFGTYPKLNNLLTLKAIQRAKETEPKQGFVVAFAKESAVDIGDIYRRCDQQVRDICRAQGFTRKEFYSKLVIPGLIPLPCDFLEADPVYKSALQEASDDV